jgi:hypothetical protein
MYNLNQFPSDNESIQLQTLPNSDTASVAEKEAAVRNYIQQAFWGSTVEPILLDSFVLLRRTRFHNLASSQDALCRVRIRIFAADFFDLWIQQHVHITVSHLYTVFAEGFGY